MVQSLHAIVEFSLKFPLKTISWNKLSNYLAALTVKDEEDLIKLKLKLDELGLDYVAFTEPDIDDQITAIAIEPGKKAKKLTSSMPLALKGFGNGVNKHNGVEA